MNNESDKMTCTLLCLGMCLVWYSITLLVGVMPGFRALAENGLVMPVLCVVEFAVLVPLWRWYSRHYDNIPSGQLKQRQTVIYSLLLLALIVSQSFYMQQESWTGSQLGDDQSVPRTIAFALAVVLLAPVFEEIIFRGFVMQALLTWAPKQRLACALLTSIIFATMHTQYAHLQTLLALIALSLLLCYARLNSSGLKLPIFLHMLNNFIGVAPWLWMTLQP
ncbi:CPBP family intramembrane glutamic endopeptidase [Pantoea sp. BAV 3049]|uniref:CPBP family intramembrane glutamic endopeptidase n=1 Tax=Pantoea sp. BAV 3049 TaxID=2654188 RepID=UPI00131DE7D0|nr:CPBP family intramembrane glutamic endopeptidase [Pantoea sp. BAV 3049]